MKVRAVICGSTDTLGHSETRFSCDAMTQQCYRAVKAMASYRETE
jgi:hypothetical protein